MEKQSGIEVLVVEDDTFMNETLCDVLESEGYEVKGATTVKEAMDSLTDRSHDYRLLLLDYNLVNNRNTTGIDIYNAAKEIYPGIKSIMMSAYGNKQIKEKALKSGINMFFDKPFMLQDLVEALNTVAH